MHLRPDRLRAHAAAAADLADALAVLGAPAGADAVTGAVHRARRELGELRAALLTAAVAAEAADEDAARSVGRVEVR